MFQTRFFNSVIAVALVATAAFSLRSVLAETQPKPAARPSQAAMAVYHQSEWSRAARPAAGNALVAYGLNEIGLTQYQASERSQTPAAPLGRLWLDLYHASEWASWLPARLGMTEAGAALYFESERAMSPAVSGLAIYHASERALVPALDGQAIYHASEWGASSQTAFSAYQRSEWLGADQ